jgi:hypothetical protein
MVQAYRLMCGVVLRNQWVEIAGAPGSNWKLERGSGMGLIPSGEIADASFYELAEKRLMCSPSIVAEYGIVLYLRFRDDILLGVTCSQARRFELFQRFSTSAGFFKLEVEAVSSTKVCWLDLEIFKGPRWHRVRRLDHALHCKATSIWQPLAGWSCHHVSVSKAWPIAELARINRRCSDPRQGKSLQDSFVSRFRGRLGYFPENSNTRLRTLDIFAGTPVPRLIFPYNFVWDGAALPQRLAAFNGVQGFGRIEIAWCLGHRHLVQRVKALNKWSSLHSMAYNSLFSIDC